MKRASASITSKLLKEGMMPQRMIRRTVALTPEQQARRDHWARVHIASDRRSPVYLADQPKVTHLGGFVVRSFWRRSSARDDR